ncbi:MAG: leucine-rich repeat protein [Oscillospiraceae bacterium]|nr:leucine-rich repeat protein [Oscillospiraceae bacterium]
MKTHTLIPIFAAALLGLSAAAVTAVSAPAALHAEAGSTVYGTTSSGLKYAYDSDGTEAVIRGYNGSAQTVTIPSYIDGKKVTVIEDEAFSPYRTFDNKNHPVDVTSVTIPNTVRSIGFRAFYQVPLNKISLPASVTSVGQEAFSSCNSLTEVKIYGKAALGYNSFRSCSKLTTVDLKDSVTLDSFSFDNCKKLTTLKIRKASTLGVGAFFGCKALQNLQMHSGCTLDDEVFSYCTALKQLNGQDFVLRETLSSGVQRPYLSTDAETRDFIRYAFTSCMNVGFLHTFCSEFCEYLVATETDPWMSDAIKARQLHDWLIRSCDYDHRESASNSPSYQENHSAYSVFVSYALDGHGKTVCEGFSKAYTMLLSQAGIESYVLLGGARIAGRSNHIWNLVKIEGQYYQCDVTWDNSYYDSGNSVAFGTYYRHHMKSNADMNNLHRINGVLAYYQPTVLSYDQSDHNLLVYSESQAEQALAQMIDNATPSVTDTNLDGILDDDYDLDGRGGADDYWDDLLARMQLAGTLYGYDTDINEKLSTVVYSRHLAYVVQTMTG